MVRTNRAILVGFSLALAACDESITRPNNPALPEKPAFNVGGMTLTPLAGGEAILVPGELGTNQAATGGRASGHYDINPFGPFTEEISFIALSTDPFPTAKGELEYHLRAPDITAVLHADINCLTTAGNQAFLSGPVERYEVNGEPVTTFTHIFVRVEDNGEGENSPPDKGSQLFAVIPPLPTDPCQSQFPAPLFPSPNGNIQVQQLEEGSVVLNM
jgi:hypothetical protein